VKRGIALVLAALVAGCSGAAPCVQRPPSAAGVEARPDAKKLLESVASRGSEAGATDLAVVAEGIVAEGDRVGGFFVAPADRCLLLFARGSVGVADLDIFAFAEDGSVVSSDESSSSDASLVVCPPYGGRMFVSARVAAGAGLVAIGAQSVVPGDAPRAAAAVGARAMGEDTGRLESWPGLEAKIRARRRAIGGAWEDVRRFAAPVDSHAPTRTTLQIEAGRCLDVLVTPGEEVASLEVVAETSDGRIAARADSDGRDRVMVLCSESGEPVTISVRPRGNAGLAAFVLARSAKGGAAEIERKITVDRLSQAATVDVARAELAKSLDAPWGKGRSAGAGQARVGSRTSLAVKLGAGCSRVDVVAGTPLGAIDAALWTEDGSLVAEASGPLRASLFSCGAASRDLRLDVEAEARPGPFVVDVRTTEATGAALAAHPMAANRLLGRLVGSEASPPTDAASATAVELVEGKLTRGPVAIPATGCVEVIAALDAGAAGVELRLLDETKDDDVLARGRFVTSQRLCGTGAAHAGRYELRLDSGTTHALVLARALPAD
jgi:hypothetical protein